MRMTLIISSLSLGGAERVLSILAKYWTESGHSVTVVTLGTSSTDWFVLHPAVIRIGLDLLAPSPNFAHAILSNVKRVQCLRTAIQRSQPDIVISFMDRTNVLTLIATRGQNIPVIVSERTDPRHHVIGRCWNALRGRMYRYADAVILQSNSVQAWASQEKLSHLTHVIPNPIDPQVAKVSSIEERGNAKHVVVAMGRLTASKRFDLLLDAFARCSDANPDWSLLIIGDGVERQRLELRSRELGIAKVTSFAGQVRDPSLLLREADIFVMTSEYEGFPNALLEAMACGLPVIACDCASGPRDIIRKGVDGILVPPNDRAALTSALDWLMRNPLERQRFGIRAVEVVERFRIDRIMRLWDDLIGRICRTSY